MKLIASLLALSLILSACSPSKEPGVDARNAMAYTLYRTGAVMVGLEDDDRKALEAMRIHVATFDAAEGSDCNRDNYDRARMLFGEQPAVTARYWCEKGVYQP